MKRTPPSHCLITVGSVKRLLFLESYCGWLDACGLRLVKDSGSDIKLEIKAPTYFPTNERMPETPPPNFEPIDSDLSKGLGSFLVTTRKVYQK